MKRKKISLDSWLRCRGCGPELDVEEVEVIRGLSISYLATEIVRRKLKRFTSLEIQTSVHNIIYMTEKWYGTYRKEKSRKKGRAVIT